MHVPESESLHLFSCIQGDPCKVIWRVFGLVVCLSASWTNTMLLKLHFGKDVIELNVPESVELVAQLCEFLEGTVDVPSHKMKLIVKGQVLLKDKLLSSYNLKDGSKLMMLANGFASQVRVTERDGPFSHFNHAPAPLATSTARLDCASQCPGFVCTLPLSPRSKR